MVVSTNCKALNFFTIKIANAFTSALNLYALCFDVRDLAFLKRKYYSTMLFFCSDKIDLKLLPFPVQVVLSSKNDSPKAVKTQLSSNFLNNLISCISEQIYEGSQEYSFLIK